LKNINSIKPTIIIFKILIFIIKADEKANEMYDEEDESLGEKI